MGNTNVSILIVDDNDDVREILAETLGDFGYAVAQASNGDQALSLWPRALEMRMLITDVRMPGMSGLELAERVRAERADIKIIIIFGLLPTAAGARAVPP